MRVRPYADRYLMADVASDRDGDLAVVNIDRSGVLESFPLPGRTAAVRRVGCGSPASDGDGARAERLRAALSARGEHEAAAQVDGRDGVRRATRGGARPAPRRAVRDRRHRARSEPDRRAGDEPRAAGCRDPRAPPRAVGPHRRAARRRAGALGAAARRIGAHRCRARDAQHVARAGRSARPRTPCGAPACGSRCCRRARACSPTRMRWGSTATP